MNTIIKIKKVKKFCKNVLSQKYRRGTINDQEIAVEALFVCTESCLMALLDVSQDQLEHGICEQILTEISTVTRDGLTAEEIDKLDLARLTVKLLGRVVIRNICEGRSDAVHVSSSFWTKLFSWCVCTKKKKMVF